METQIYRYGGEKTSSGLKILYEDNHLICVLKQPGVLSQADGTDKQDMLSILKKDIALAENKPGDAFVALIHRLDTNTGGTMVFGKTSKGASRISEQLRNRDFHKCYFAVVSGSMREREGYLFNRLSKDEKNNKVYEDKNGRECLLYYEKIEEKNGKTLVCAYPITGRTHQIRAQFALCSHPLCGDVKYGTKNVKGIFSLWSCACCFKHPTKEIMLMMQSIPERYGDFTDFDENTFIAYLDGLTADKLISAGKGFKNV